MYVAREAGGFDGAVEHVTRFGELAAQQLHLSADRVGERDEFALPGGPGDGEDAFGVSFAFGVPVEVELGPGEVGDGVEPLRNFGVVERVDEVCGFGSLWERLGGGVVGGRGERSDRRRSGEERAVVERPGGAQRGARPTGASMGSP